MSKHLRLQLTPEHRFQLKKLIRSGKASASVQTRARILLLTDYSHGEHMTDFDIVAALFVNQSTVVRVRHKYLAEGLEAMLQDKPRPGRPPKITGDVEAQLTVLACSTPPEGYRRWTLRLLADKLVELGQVDSISHTAIQQRLKKTP